MTRTDDQPAYTVTIEEFDGPTFTIARGSLTESKSTARMAVECGALRATVRRYQSDAAVYIVEHPDAIARTSEE